MRARNRLLNDLSAADPSWLSALETQMDEHGAALAAARLDLVGRLQAALEDQPDHPFARPLLAIEGEGGGEEPLGFRLPRARRRAAAAGRTLSGPRSDERRGGGECGRAV